MLPQLSTTTNGRIEFNLETTSIDNSVNPRALYLSGWCFNPQSDRPAAIELCSRRETVTTVRCGKRREDVSKAFSDESYPNSLTLYSGFEEWVIVPNNVRKLELKESVSGLVLAVIPVPLSSKASPTLNPWLLHEGHGRYARSLSLSAFLFLKAVRSVRTGSILSLRNWRRWIRRGLNIISDKAWRKDRSLTRRERGVTPANAYAQRNKLRPQVRTLLENAVTEFAYSPTISIIMPVYNVEPRYLKTAIESVRSQIYPKWELCIADDASTRSEICEVLRYYETDPRIRIVYREENGHISAASNSAAELATGDFVALLDNDDWLEPHALFEIVRLLQSHREADVIYTDEDKYDINDNHYDLHFKPDWSPVLLLGYNYINHLTIIRKSLFDQVGRFRIGFEGAQDYDLLLRVTEVSRRVFHIPKILYHWRASPGSTALCATEKDIVGTSARRTLEEAISRRNVSAKIYMPEFAKRLGIPIHQLSWPDIGPAVDIIIPTLNRVNILQNCIESIRQLTTYRNYRVIVIDTGSDPKETGPYYDRLDEQGIEITSFDNGPEGFSFSKLNNAVIRRSDAELVLLLNSDTEVIEPKWLSRLVGYLSLPGVGAVGARLLYPDGRVQHGGIVFNAGSDGLPAHAFTALLEEDAGYFFLAQTARECSAVTGACLLTRRQTYLELGGFDEDSLPISLNDADFCLRMQQAGQTIVFVPGAELRHYEFFTCHKEDEPRETAAFRERHRFTKDPYYNINLSRLSLFETIPECMLDYQEYLRRPLHILFFSHNLNYEGAPNVLFDIARGLVSTGCIEVVIASIRDGPQREQLEREGFDVYVLPDSGDDDNYDSVVRTNADFLSLVRPNVVVANTLESYMIVEAANKQQMPSIWWIHESYDKTLFERHFGSERATRCENALYKATRLLFVSEGTAQLFSKFDSGYNSRVIRNSIDTDRITRIKSQTSKAAARSALGIPDDKLVIVNVGAVCERKNQAALLDAVTLLSRKRQDFICLFVGHQHATAYGRLIEYKVDHLGIADYVNLIPTVENVDNYYLSADVFAFTSLNESFPLVILEAMAFGLPVVTTRCVGVNEQVRFGVNALPAELGNPDQLASQLEILLENEQLRKTMGERSACMIQYMQTRDEMIEQHESLLYSCYFSGAQ